MALISLKWPVILNEKQKKLVFTLIYDFLGIFAFFFILEIEADSLLFD